MTTRVSLFDRLPATHKLQDAALAAAGQPGPLQAYLSHVEDVLSDVKASIDALYHDLFIETCADWVVPYIGDLLGTSHLAGDPWTLRADVADTILLRRAKGTLGAIQQLAFDLTAWGVHPVELRDNLAWAQALNHQRPDAGGAPAYAATPLGRHTVIRGGFATIRDPATLSLIGTPFDQFARFADVSIPCGDRVGYNLPNLAVFLWRLATYRVELVREVATPATPVTATGHAAPLAAYVARFYVDPLARPVQLFGLSTYDPDVQPPVLTPVDGQPAPIAPARLTSPSTAPDGAFGGNPGAYVAATTYTESASPIIAVGDLPLELHVPEPDGGAGPWTFRGANLCAWEAGLAPPLQLNEIAIDPLIGRIAIGAATQAQAQALASGLALTYTYGAVGNVGAHPDARDPLPAGLPAAIVVSTAPGSPTLAAALATLATNATGPSAPLVIELDDDEIHDLDISAVTGAITDGTAISLGCGRPLYLRSQPNRRPIIRLARPLRFEPVPGAVPSNTSVRIDGLTFVAGPGMAAADALISRASMYSLDLRDCTLAPGGDRVLDGTSGGTRAPSRTGLRLAAADATASGQQPALSFTRCITGPLFVDAQAYTITLTSSIVDAGPNAATGAPALAGAGVPTTTYCAALVIDGVTIFGSSRVEQIAGQGGIFTGTLFVDDDQTGCLKLCWFSNQGDRLPQHSGCVQAPGAPLAFTSEVFGAAAYGQLSRDSDSHVLERGPNDDEMGAFGFLLEAHKWKNLDIRLREFTPAGVRTLLIPAT